ncbi:MAG: alpha/beta fold hydrolase [Tabrizicola sp.]
MPSERFAGQLTHWRVWEQGGDRPVLALHCMLAHAGVWAGMARMLHGVDLSAPDAIGHGQSAAWNGQAPFHRQATDVAIEMSERLGKGRPIDLIGHSFGGTVALRLALERPDLVRSLVLIEPVLFAAGRGTDAFAEIALLDQRVSGCLPDNPEGAAWAFHGFWGTGGRLSDLPEHQRDYIIERIALVPLSTDVLARDAAGILRPGGLEGFPCPVTLLEGASSPRSVSVIQTTLAARFPQSTRVVVQNAGHMLPVTHPKAVAEAVQAHLART